MGWNGPVSAEEFFAWKHDQNVFGSSPAWTAWDGSRLIGFRTMMRWRFVSRSSTVEALRPVDTVTDPSVRRKGVFRALTTRALDDLRSVQPNALIFNTPNDQSRPGYLAMGWSELGRPATWAHISRPGAAPRIIRSLVPAEKWSEPSTAGLSGGEAFADAAAVDQLLSTQPRAPGLRTEQSVEYLRWRYGFGPLHYRVFTGPNGVGDGVAIVRARRRGRALETVVSDVIVPHDATRLRRELITLAARSMGGDYQLLVGRRPRSSWLPIAGRGPVVTARTLNGSPPPPLRSWDFRLGDIELF